MTSKEEIEFLFSLSIAGVDDAPLRSLNILDLNLNLFSFSLFFPRNPTNQPKERR